MANNFFCRSNLCGAGSAAAMETALEKANLNPFAKSFSFNPMAKEWSPPSGAKFATPTSLGPERNTRFAPSPLRGLSEYNTLESILLVLAIDM